VCFQAGRQGALLRSELFLLLQEFLLLGNQAAHFTPQFGEFFLEGVDGFLRRGLFILVMPTETLQQRFGLVIRVFVTAAHRARLIVLQLLAQFLDAGTARQALAFQQLFGHRQRLLGDRQLGLGLQAGLVQLFALLLGVGKLLCQRAGLLIQLLLAVP
jgi:hypothetical protein